MTAPVRSVGSRRPLRLLAAATAVGSLGLGAGGTAGALVAAEVTGGEFVTGLPLGALVVGSAISAVLVARIGRRAGRAAGLAVAYLLGVAGAVVVIVATVTASLTGVLLGSLLLGGANAAVFLTRYAAADLVADGARGRAVGWILTAIAGGAVTGVYLLGPAGQIAAAAGLPPPIGLYLVAIPAFAVACLLLAGLARAAGQRRAPMPSADRSDSAGIGGLLRAQVGGPSAAVALALLGIGNLAMTAIMVVVPVHLAGHGHHLHAVGLLVSIHVAGMFAPSPVTGWLADAVGPRRIGAGGLAILVTTAALWAATGATGAVAVGVLLTGLGVGWNAAVVAGSTLLAAGIPAGQRLDAEAGGEIAMGLAAAISAPAAGIITAIVGFPGLCVAIALTSAAGLVMSARSPRSGEARPPRSALRRRPNPWPPSSPTVRGGRPTRVQRTNADDITLGQQGQQAR